MHFVTTGEQGRTHTSGRASDILMLSKMRNTTRKRSFHHDERNRCPYVLITSNMTVSPLQEPIRTCTCTYMTSHFTCTCSRHSPRSDVELAAVDDATEFKQHRKPASHPHAVLLRHVQHLLLVAAVLAKQLQRNEGSNHPYAMQA